MGTKVRGGDSSAPKIAGFYDAVNHELSDRRIVLATGVVDDDMSHEISMRLRYMDAVSSAPIKFYLNTPGGSIISGLAIFDLITSMQSPVDVIATGACMSMGTIILQAGARRLATPNTHFLLHELSMTNQGSLGQLKDTQKHAERLQRHLNEILSKRTGLTVAKLSKIIERRDHYLDIEAARELNLIDGIANEKVTP